jgi:hypothetical protein
MKSRPFGLIDAMIVVCAVAVGFSINRGDWGFWNHWQLVTAHALALDVLALILPHIALASVAALILRMRQPRPSFRRVAREPGAVASLVAVTTLLLILVWTGGNLATGGLVQYGAGTYRRTGGGHGVIHSIVHNPFTGALLVAFGDRVSFAVAGAWLSLLAAGRWRPERTWIDRLGRAMAWLWIAAAAALWLSGFLL